MQCPKVIQPQSRSKIEVELSDSSDSDRGTFRSVVPVRISSTDKQACELMKEAIQLATQEALGAGEIRDDEITIERKH